MDTMRVCQQCRAPIAAGSPQDICPVCLLRAGMQSASDFPTTPSSLPPGTGGAAVPPVAMPRVGERFGHYQILRLLGRGGMGEVFEAEDTLNGRRIALKVMNHSLTSEQDQKRFLREGRLAASVSHPNVVYIYGSEEINGVPVIAMELVPDGTLKDRIKREGSLPVKEAVEAALRLIDGLEAAAAAGVLHRDIKPANCFIDAEGAVKVGDFGLSISTFARGESMITATGSVMGTPAYASPEQLRGEEIDVASDIYSVGATLYHLLTGRPPHDATDFVKLITEVLDKPPVPPDKLRPEIPRGLSRVVLRCLAKNRAARFPNYALLRRALLPFSSLAPTPATLGLRFVAGFIDELGSGLPTLIIMAWSGEYIMDTLAAHRAGGVLLAAILVLLWDFFYFAVPEGLWGAAFGKSVCGLRVVGMDRNAPGLGRAALRTLIFRTWWTVPLIVTLALFPAQQFLERLEADQWNPADWMSFPLLLLLFVTARRRNGFAGLHELASGTRVIARASAQERPGLDAPSDGVATASAPASVKAFGPYEVVASLGVSSTVEWFLARDEALRRPVWILRQPAGTPVVPARRRDLSRAGRLRWLNGHRDEAAAWDAYEAPEGTPLPSVLAAPQQWNAVRFWLHDLAEEFDAGSRGDSLPPAWSLDRVWITKAGQAVALDVPWPGASAADAAEFAAIPAPEGLPMFQRFLTEIATRALRRDEAKATPAPLPLHAQPFLRSLAEGRFESAEILLGNLQSILAKWPVVTRSRRLASLAFAMSIPLLLGLLLGAMTFGLQRRAMLDWPKEFAGSAELRAELKALDNGHLDRELRRVLRKHMVAHHSDLILNSNFWAHPVVAKDLSKELRDEAEEAVRDYGSMSAEELRATDALVPAMRDSFIEDERRTPLLLAVAVFILFLFIAAVVDGVVILISGEGIFLRLFGIVPVRRDGTSAGRLRLLWRAFLAWIVCCAGAPLALLAWFTWTPVPMPNSAKLIIFGAMAAVTVVGVAWAILRPARGPQDWLAGTRLVPR